MGLFKNMGKSLNGRIESSAEKEARIIQKMINLATNPNASWKDLDRLVTSSQIPISQDNFQKMLPVFIEVADNKNTEEMTLNRLVRLGIENYHDDLLFFIASNPNASNSIFDEILNYIDANNGINHFSKVLDLSSSGYSAKLTVNSSAYHEITKDTILRHQNTNESMVDRLQTYIKEIDPDNCLGLLRDNQ